MIKPVGEWFHVEVIGNTTRAKVLGVPDSSHWPAEVGDTIIIDLIHLKQWDGTCEQFIHRNYILGVIND
jgi:hypothetical protein